MTCHVSVKQRHREICEIRAKFLLVLLVVLLIYSYNVIFCTIYIYIYHKQASLSHAVAVDAIITNEQTHLCCASAVDVITWPALTKGFAKRLFGQSELLVPTERAAKEPSFDITFKTVNDANLVIFPATCVTLLSVYLLMYLLKALYVTAQSTAQGHSGLFTSSNLAQVEYNTKHAHYINVKYTNINRQLVPSVSLL